MTRHRFASHCPMLRRSRRLVALVAILVWPAFAWAGWPSTADRLTGHLMFTFYLAQYANPAYDGVYARWNDLGQNPAGGDLMAMFWPHDAAYSNSEPCSGIYASQSINMKRAGIDVVVINWWNAYPGEQQRVEQALRCFGANGFKAIIAVYPNWNDPRFDEVVGRLETVMGWYANTSLFPAYYRDPASGSPLFWVGNPDSVGSAAAWNAKIDWYKSNVSPRGIFIAAESSVEWARQTRFDGFYWTGSNGFDPAGDRHNHEWILYNLYVAGPYNQFYVGGGGPGIDERALCHLPNPRVVSRQGGAVFNSQWSDIINSQWNGHKVDHAEVGWNDWGESEGIEPVTSNPPLRSIPYQDCGGRVPQTYFTYAPLSEYWYLDQNAYWRDQFKRTRPGFADVPPSHPFFAWIQAVVRAGIDWGCAADRFCPDDVITRAAMAGWLLRGIHGGTYYPPAAVGMFADVPVASPAAPWIEQLAREAITSGCGANPPTYCPSAAVTRGQMAVFLLRAKYGAAYQPPAATGMFADVPVDHPLARWIERLAQEGITGGCATNPARYCPDAGVTRGQMAVFVARAFNLPL